MAAAHLLCAATLALYGALVLSPAAWAVTETGPRQSTRPTPAASPQSDPCRGEPGLQGERLDRLREGVQMGVCSSSRWFDRLFGDARDDSEGYQENYGRVGIGLGWDELDGVGADGHFRASVHLPILGERFNAVIGRETEDSFIDDNFDDIGFLPGSFSDDQEADWYAGINYNALEGTNSRFDLSAGVQLKSPINPYIKARYRHFIYPARDWRITTRSTLFWENEDGFGLTLAADTDWSLDEGSLLRWANTLTRSETTDGVRWKSRLAWYQALSRASAMRYEVLIRGETGGVEPDRRELKITYRRAVWREWFFLETSGGVFWADDELPEKRCDGCALVGVGFELMFGERYDSPVASGNGAE